ncbi:hypothetical protein [Roseivivax isoporae]|uniref:DnaA N-terminal domain-containing protein n=1 Tax=Roseivivax isoporae LMG 25204 TaxID=1449351 RepID=X7F7G5_9RHOB|nr:hypothetical protein [Roseivivax isoporae]ETX28872.1 hypothetical protein RISW2_03955 [Roseivivax isoporae LMG 25204]
MRATRPAGRNAPALKYDILTAMGTHALRLSKGPQCLVLRFITLLTARYNWMRNELCVGQREIAALWNVDERTVKREMAKLRAMGWIRVRRQGARGRVTEYQLDLDVILEATRPCWPAVGPDYALRMEGTDAPPRNVVALPPRGEVAPPDVTEGTEWALARAVLHAEDPAGYGAWFAALVREGRAGGRLVLRAPSRFHATYVATHFATALLAACRSVDEDVDDVAVIA